jgi:hypothetical protein
LRERLTRVRWATGPRDAADGYGVPLSSVQDLAAYWLDGYDWRAWWGSYIAPEIGRVAPDALIGVHVTQIPSLPDGESPYYPPTADRRPGRHLGAYHHMHAQQPQTLAYALTDSPVGLLAWCRQVMGDLDPETLLTHVCIQWLTGTAGSALRIYAEHERQPPAAGPTTVPLGLAQFQRDAHAIRAPAERDHASIVSWNSSRRPLRGPPGTRPARQ